VLSANQCRQRGATWCTLGECRGRKGAHGHRSACAHLRRGPCKELLSGGDLSTGPWLRLLASPQCALPAVWFEFYSMTNNQILCTPVLLTPHTARVHVHSHLHAAQSARVVSSRNTHSYAAQAFAPVATRIINISTCDEHLPQVRGNGRRHEEW